MDSEFYNLWVTPGAQGLYLAKGSEWSVAVLGNHMQC